MRRPSLDLLGRALERPYPADEKTREIIPDTPRRRAIFLAGLIGAFGLSS
jgi:hypothetical protein